MDKVSAFKETMANYPTGVTIVTAVNAEGSPIGLTVNSFASVSLDPMLILWSIDKKSASYDALQKVQSFAVNILAEDQADTALLFASRTNSKERFENCNWKLSSLNLPIITGTAAALQCNVYNRIEAGDHTILIGEVSDIYVEKKSPLLYHQRRMGALPASFHEQ